MSPKSTAAAGFAALVLAGCDPVFHVEGSVVARDGAAPIAGAHVTLRCPSSSFERTADSTATGRFVMSGVGAITKPDDCVLTVSKSGYETRTAKLAEVCYLKRADRECDPKSGVLALSPAAAP